MLEKTEGVNKNGKHVQDWAEDTERRRRIKTQQFRLQTNRRNIHMK